jgi:hypothetical protein
MLQLQAVWVRVEGLRRRVRLRLQQLEVRDSRQLLSLRWRAHDVQEGRRGRTEELSCRMSELMLMQVEHQRVGRSDAQHLIDHSITRSGCREETQREEQEDATRQQRGDVL